MVIKGLLFESLMDGEIWMSGIYDFSPSRGCEIQGITVGMVSNVEDPDGLGRIKVKLPGWGDHYETDWAPVVVPIAGDKCGFFFLPGVGEEVVVAFRGGDINSPYVLGSTWANDKKPLGTSQDAKDNLSAFKSRKGHLLTFDDKKECIEICAASGHKIAINKDKIQIEDKNGNNFLHIDTSKGAIEVSSKGDLSIKATNITIEATQSLKISSSGQAEIKSTKLTVESSSNLSLKANALLEVQGSIVKIN